MTVTVEEAKTKNCCQTINCMCRGDSCMGWIWYNIIEEKIYDKTRSPFPSLPKINKKVNNWETI